VSRSRPNPWLTRRPLNIAHQGGAREAPSNTLYAFATSVRTGALGLELDVHLTADGHVVVCHDPTVDRTTNGSGSIDSLTLEQVQRLDAAYWFVPGEGVVPGRPPEAYPLRGVATGDRPPPAGHDPWDFTIPTLADVLTDLPDVHVNIDIKRTAPETAAYEDAVADLVRRHGRSDDVIVGSFSDTALDRFKAIAPEVFTAAGPADTFAFWSALQDEEPASTALADHVALQVPVQFQGLQVVTPAFVAAAHDQGIAVHVWTIDEPEEMARLLAMGVDGVVTDRPSVLAAILRQAAAD
jgi:glycerophosphoryl diester phosphodiesterase